MYADDGVSFQRPCHEGQKIFSHTTLSNIVFSGQIRLVCSLATES
jgi:hypothetical protein